MTLQRAVLKRVEGALKRHGVEPSPALMEELWLAFHPERRLGELQVMVGALARVTGQAAQLNGGKLAKFGTNLLRAGLCPEDLERLYGRGNFDSPRPAERAWWYAENWKGQRGEWPALADISVTVMIGLAREQERAAAARRPIELG